MQLGWKGTVVVMLKTQIGLGVLTVPQVFETLGLIPGAICVVVVGSMITWSNYIVGAFKLRHPNVYGIEDIGRIFLGRFGYEFFGWLFAVCKLTCFVRVCVLIVINARRLGFHCERVIYRFCYWPECIDVSRCMYCHLRCYISTRRVRLRHYPDARAHLLACVGWN